MPPGFPMVWLLPITSKFSFIILYHTLVSCVYPTFAISSSSTRKPWTLASWRKQGVRWSRASSRMMAEFSRSLRSELVVCSLAIWSSPEPKVPPTWKRSRRKVIALIDRSARMTFSSSRGVNRKESRRSRKLPPLPRTENRSEPLLRPRPLPHLKRLLVVLRPRRPM